MGKSYADTLRSQKVAVMKTNTPVATNKESEASSSSGNTAKLVAATGTVESPSPPSDDKVRPLIATGMAESSPSSIATVGVRASPIAVTQQSECSSSAVLKTELAVMTHESKASSSSEAGTMHYDATKEPELFSVNSKTEFAVASEHLGSSSSVVVKEESSFATQELKRTSSTDTKAEFLEPTQPVLAIHPSQNEYSAAARVDFSQEIEKSHAAQIQNVDSAPESEQI